jgi:hypothetical protein
MQYISTLCSCNKSESKNNLYRIEFTLRCPIVMNLVIRDGGADDSQSLEED